MKTTTKQFKQKVQQYITDRLGNTWDEETQSENENATTAERLQNAVNEFLSWYSPYEQRRTPNRAEAFREFLQGLPGCLSVDFMTYNIILTVAAWHEQTPAEAESYDTDKTLYQFYYLIYREFRNLCRQFNIDFNI